MSLVTFIFLLFFSPRFFFFYKKKCNNCSCSQLYTSCYILWREVEQSDSAALHHVQFLAGGGLARETKRRWHGASRQGGSRRCPQGRGQLPARFSRAIDPFPDVADMGMIPEAVPGLGGRSCPRWDRPRWCPTASPSPGAQGAGGNGIFQAFPVLFLSQTTLRAAFLKCSFKELFFPPFLAG